MEDLFAEVQCKWLRYSIFDLKSDYEDEVK